MVGYIADIQRFSLHDGPGIRTSVFLKGCDMNCAWCHNPETISFEQDIIIDEDKCIHCGKCDEGCYSGARRPVGREMTVEAVMDEVMLDKPYYGSEGGVTITGGEPALQPEFSVSLLEAAKIQGLHCAVESNLHVDYAVSGRLYNCCDLVMCDVKTFDPVKHEKWTGVSNDTILDNLKRIDELGIPLIVRTPVVPGVNDTTKEIGAIAQFLRDIKNLRYYELLPYHSLGLSKRLLNKNSRPVFEKPSKEVMNLLAREAAKYGMSIKIAAKNFSGG
jgi:pyruvate formate lyase activating enzyme